MDFNKSHGVDFKAWRRARLHRQNNGAQAAPKDDDIPKFGAGSVFGREQKEEARRRRLGIREPQGYQSERQPWMLEAQVGLNREKKRFRGIKEGGVNSHSVYYVFCQGKDGNIDAYPINEW